MLLGTLRSMTHVEGVSVLQRVCPELKLATNLFIETAG